MFSTFIFQLKPFSLSCLIYLMVALLWCAEISPETEIKLTQIMYVVDEYMQL